MIYYINPSDLKPEKQGDIFYYSESINENFINCFIISSLVFLIIGILGVLLIKDPEIHSEASEDNPEHNYTKKIIKTAEFWLISLVFCFGFLYRIFFISEYKRIGLETFGDLDLSLIGIIGAISEAGGQLFIGYLYDKYDQFALSKIISSIIFINSATMYIASYNIISYGIYYSILAASTVYIFNAISSLVNLFFPYDFKKGFSLVSLGFIASSIVSIGIENFLLSKIGLTAIFMVFSIINLIVLGLYFRLGYLLLDNRGQKESLLGR